MHFAKDRRLVAQLLDGAIDGRLTIEEFYKQWPEQHQEETLLSIIYEDIEEGVQHFPAKLLSGAPDRAVWTASDMYRRLRVDREVLNREGPEVDLVKLRNELLGQNRD